MKAGVIAALLVSLPLGVRAQEAEAEEPDAQQTAAARALFEEGVGLADAEAWDDAADRFRRSLALRASPVVAYNLASALVHVEHLVEASELLQAVVHDDSAPAAARDAARALLDRVQPRLARLTIRLDGDPTRASVSIDERSIPMEAIGVSIPVDPGSRTVRVRRDGELVAEAHVTLLAGATAETRIEVPPAPEPPPVAESEPEETGYRPGDALREELPRPAPVEVRRPVPSPEQAARTTVRVGRPRARAPAEPEDEGTFLESPWFWAGVGAGVLAGGIVALILVLSAGDDIPPGVNGTTDPPLIELGK